jgi:DNA (cytosine-5)-methyltransferase 1
MTLADALKAGVLYETDVPRSPGYIYTPSKAAILKHVPPRGYWRHLPAELREKYARKYSNKSKTDIKRRLAWDEPSFTVLCLPNRKERCHPDETRPLTAREHARIQTFPDSWEFHGSLTSQYQQIGNAVPVNLAEAIGRSLVRLLNSIETKRG